MLKPATGYGPVGPFYDAGLLDESIVPIGAVTLGRGKPLLPHCIDRARALRLTPVKRLGAGMAELRYEVTRALAEPT